MVDQQLNELSQTQRERLFHIDFKAWFLGSLNRTDLIDRFGIKEAAATRDLSLYRDFVPENLKYDSIARIYRCSDNFKPLFEHRAEQTLSALSQGFGDNGSESQAALINSERPAYLNQPNIEVIAKLSRAIAQSLVLKINYCSVSSGATTREIIPFALVDTGTRWHVRAYDRKKVRFTDFVLTRITEPDIMDSTKETHEKIESDIQWNRIVELELVPHPDLRRRDAIILDYVMEDGVLRVNVRAAVAGYVLQRWNVDCTEDHHLDANQHHLWLKNREALYGVDNLILAPGYQSSFD